MSKVDIYADDFGIAPGLEVSMRWVEGEKVAITVMLDGQVFESHAPRDVGTAMAVAGCLIRGCAPPRRLLRGFGEPAP